MAEARLEFLSSKTFQWILVLLGVILFGFVILRNECSITGESCFNLLQFTLNGLMIGGVYSLVALGIVIINKASGVFNFAHGMIMLFGGMIFWQTFDAIPSTELSVILGVMMAVIVMTVISDIAPASHEATQQTRWQRWLRILRSPRFLAALAASVIAGVLIVALIREVKEELVRGAIGGLVGSIALGLAIERFTIRPLLGQPILASIMMTLAVFLILQGAISLIWGSQPRSLSVFVEPAREQKTVVPIGINPNTGETIFQEISAGSVPPKVLPNYVLDTEELLGKDLSFARNLVWGFAVAITCFIAFVLFFQFTNTGLAMRAVAENQTLAESVGLRVRTILAVAWAIATTMAMVAAVIQGTGPGVGLSVLVIPPLAFRAFPAVLLGGLESITGALVGGLVIGVVETLVSALVDTSTGQEMAPFLVLLIVLLIRPDGLFGQRRIDRV